MPTVSRVISEQPDHIFMPVAQQLSHRILHMLGYEDIIGDNIMLSSEWSTHSKTYNRDENARVSENKFKADVEVQMNPNSQKWEAYTFKHTTAYGVYKHLIHQQEAIYVDPYNRVRIMEMLSPINIILNCELTLVSAELAFKTPLQLFNGYENGSVATYTDLFFDYPVPKEIVSILYHIWELDRDNGKSNNVPFMEYIKIRTNGTWTVTKHRDLEEYEITIPRYNLKSLCSLEYSSDKPQGLMENKLPTGWNIPFTYTVQFGMPTMQIIEYPCVIYNQLVDSMFIPVDTNIRFNGMPEYRTDNALQHYDNKEMIKHQDYLSVPWYDDWSIPLTRTLSNTYDTFAVLHLLVDEVAGLYTRIDLKEDVDDDYKLDEIILTLLKGEGCMCTDIHSPVNVALFRDDTELIPNKDYYVDDNLILVFKARDLYSHYRVVISTATEANILRPQWYQMCIKEYHRLPIRLRESIGYRFLQGEWTHILEKHVRCNVSKIQCILSDGTVIDRQDRILGDIKDIYVLPDIHDIPSIDLDMRKVTATVMVDQTTNTIYYPGMQLPEDGYFEKRDVVLSKEVLNHAINKNVGIDIYTFKSGKAGIIKTRS